MEIWGKSYSDIKTVDQNGIIFIDGDRVIFEDCIGKRYNSETCVAERDICAMPSYFEFFTPDKPIRIVFNKKGLFSKYINKRHFLKLQMQITDIGYSTYDLS